MKLCPNCDQPVSEEIATCPSCGNHVGEGRRTIDDYRILDVVHEGHSSLLCQALRERTGERVMIRLFTSASGVDAEVAGRLQHELSEIQKLPGHQFVRHHAIRKSSDGLWYRVSEWIESESWGAILASGRLRDLNAALELFYQIAATLESLHASGHIIPHLILNDIIAAPADDNGRLIVKLDYKLSRFLDPAMDRPGPMLKRLLACHPDIVGGRPLDHRSDIWSLGKVYVELLTADLEMTDPAECLEPLEISDELKVLLKVMLADDPDLRPQSMSDVTNALVDISRRFAAASLSQETGAAVAPLRRIQKVQKRLQFLAAAVLLLVTAAIFAWYQLDYRHRDVSLVMERHANRYASSVAFLLVEYWLEVNGQRLYHNMSEGTAFLVDAEGYMLTSRHVACPWLEDARLAAHAYRLQQRSLAPEFGYRLFMWFDGAKAFNPVARVMDEPEVGDVYFTESAFSSETPPRVDLMGVANIPTQTREIIASPLRDDVAVLKIERPPPGMVPLDLDAELQPQNLRRLSSIIALGFPLGRRTQEDRVSTSVTAGHVRRSFDNLIQVDASLYGGNSGGPVIDTRGKVIGIVSGVALDWTPGIVPTVTPIWDIGMVLPINKAVTLLDGLKNGQIKWNGVLDFTVEARLKRIKAVANNGRWAEAARIAEAGLGAALPPALLEAAGMMHYCAGDLQQAQLRFAQALSMDADQHHVRFMMALIDWKKDRYAASSYRRQLAALDWRSPAEFQGYLVRVLDGQIAPAEAEDGWQNAFEKGWLSYVTGLRQLQGSTPEMAEEFSRKAVLAAEPETWEYCVFQSELEKIQRQLEQMPGTGQQIAQVLRRLRAAEDQIRETDEAKRRLRRELTPLLNRLSDRKLAIEERLATLKKAVAIQGENRSLRYALAFYTAADGNWPAALETMQRLLSDGGRANVDRLVTGLLATAVLKYLGNDAEADEMLVRFVHQNRDPWFLAIAETLLGKHTRESLLSRAGDSPENMLTAHTVVGLWSEAGGDRQQAVRHYKEALESFLDAWPVYDFARLRIKKLRQRGD
jgi:S1-C subfamily serine protease